MSHMRTGTGVVGVEVAGKRRAFEEWLQRRHKITFQAGLWNRAVRVRAIF